jgi:hypothetical protein
LENEWKFIPKELTNYFIANTFKDMTNLRS